MKKEILQRFKSPPPPEISTCHHCAIFYPQRLSPMFRKIFPVISSLSLILLIGTATEAMAGASNNDKIIVGNQGDFFGGETNTTGISANHNTVKLQSDVTVDNIYGGFTDTGSRGNANRNTVEISNGTVLGNVYGGYTAHLGNANDNVVKISGGTVKGSVYGGWTTSGGNAFSNIVNITDGTVEKDVVGGRAFCTIDDSHAAYNTVNIRGGEVKGNVIGGRSGIGNAYLNTVNVFSGDLTSVYGGRAVMGTAHDNIVNINGGAIQHVYGGKAERSDANGNIVNINGGVVTGDVIGGFANNEPITTGGSRTGDANNNIVNIRGGTSGQVFGGYTYNIFPDTTITTGDAKNNIVNITGGEVDFVAGGKTGGTGNATYNTVEISGTTKINYDIWGGTQSETIGTGDVRTGNTLILNQTNLTITSGGATRNTGTVKNFENYVFNPSYENIMNNEPMLTAENIYLGENANLSIGGTISGNEIDKGTEFTLMEATNSMTGNFANIGDTHTLKQGVALEYEYDVTADLTIGNGTGGRLTATITSALKASKQSKVPAETQIASVTMLNQGADLLSEAGIKNALRATANMSVEADSWASFSAIGGGKSRYETGSYSDVTGLSLVAGFANRDNDFLYGVFFEYGYADIDTHNTFATHSVDTNGDSKYYGGGMFARFENSSNIYGEVSLRVGVNEVTQSSTNYDGFVGQAVNYETSSLYYGAHIGTGYLWEINNKNSLDIYAKYFWTHQDEDSVTLLTAGDTFDFEDINSHRTRLGSRYSYAITEIQRPYIGLAWEHEFGGDAESSVNNIAAGVPTLEGSTAIIEIGLVSMTKDADSPFSIDIGIEGYLGTREGVSGKAQFAYHF